MRVILIFLTTLLLSIWLPSSRAIAQVSAIDQPAIDVERLWLQPGPGAFFAATDATVLSRGQIFFSFLGSLMSRPIVLADIQTGVEASVPVDLRLGYEVAVARGMGKRWQIGMALPVVAAQSGDRLQGIGLSEQSLAPVALGDIRFHTKLRLQRDSSSRLGVAIAAHIRLPSGNEQQFAGEASAVLGASLLGAYQGENWRVAANLGLRLRAKDVLLISPSKRNANEVLLAIAGEYRVLSLPLGLVGEYAKVAGDGLGPSPGEARIGIAAYLLPRATLTLATSRGTTPGQVGAPAWRVFTMFSYQGQSPAASRRH